MYLMYVDESGDTGLAGSPTDYFCLTGMVIHENNWDEVLKATIEFRRQIKEKYGFKLREEIHSSHFLHKPGDLQRIAKSMRLRLLRDVLDFQATLVDKVDIINVVVNKTNKAEGVDIFNIAWQTLIQRFENTLKHDNFVGGHKSKEKGMLFVDQTDEIKLRNIIRRMRKYNPIPSSMGLVIMPYRLIV